MNAELEIDEVNSEALTNYALALADDSLIIGHRLSEWSSNGPFLEEDLALTNVALDYIGRARMLYSYAGEVEAKGRTEDDFAYLRDCRDYRNLLICEMPNGDFGQTIARQFLLDAFDLLFFEALTDSRDDTLVAIAGKAIKEVVTTFAEVGIGLSVLETVRKKAMRGFRKVSMNCGPIRPSSLKWTRRNRVSRMLATQLIALHLRSRGNDLFTQY